MDQQFKKIINLIKKTGDRMVVLDSSAPESSYVVMDIDEYEKIITHNRNVKNLTEEEMLDKINRDIAVWKSEKDLEDNEKIKDFKDNEISKIVEEIADTETDKSSKNNWQIPTERKSGFDDLQTGETLVEGNIEGEEDEDGLEEDKHYLEELNY